MNNQLTPNNSKFFSNINTSLSDLQIESEGQEYHAARFKLDEQKIIYRKAKITPKKIGQFVTCWRRNSKGITTPFHTHDDFDSFIIAVETNSQLGLFVFPKSILEQQGIISTDKKDGKRGFRIYPPWDEPTSKQAIRTKKWQLEYFADVNIDSSLHNMIKFT